MKNLFSSICQQERTHLDTVNSIMSGIVPDTAAGGSYSPVPDCGSGYADEESKNQDKFLCSDMLAGEKHVSSVYDTCIFEFSDASARKALNHIQKEEQQHGEMIYNFMNSHGMYC